MTIYAKIDADGIVDHCDGELDPPDMVGPLTPAPLGDGWMLITTMPGPRPHKDFVWKADDGVVSWHDPRTLDQARADKIAEMSQACGEHIVAGFTSSALGAEYLYPAKPQDQANLIASVTDSLLAGDAVDWTTPFWCADASGDWQFRPHTIAQIQQVGREGKAATLAAMSRNEQLRRQIEATDAADLPTIVWSMP